jgi:predicted phosphodiesterase
MILFAADCHGDFVPLIEEAGPATAVVLLGDQEPLGDLAVELGPGVAPKTWWIYGNHDSDDLEYLPRHATMADRNLHCRMVEIEGLRIAGLGGVFRQKKFGVDKSTRVHEMAEVRPYDTRESIARLRRGRVNVAKDYTTIFPEDIEALLQLAGKVDVLVTHEAPESHTHGFQLIGDLARALGVKLLIHGHHHERYSATLDGGIRVEGVGMAGMLIEWKRPEDGLLWVDPGKV